MSMSNKDMKNQHQNREEDVFYDFFKNSLEDHELSVDDKCWENINQHIAQKKRTVVIRPLWTALTAVACILLILVFIVTTTSPIEPEYVAENEIEIDTNSIPLTSSVTPTTQMTAEADVNAILPKTQTVKRVNHESRKNEAPIAHSAPKVEKQDKNINQSNETKSSNQEEEANVAHKIDSLPTKKKITSLNPYSDNEVIYLADNKSSSNKWGISASISGAGSSSQTGSENIMVRTAPAFVNSSVGPMIGSNSISDIKYAPPFTVGMLVRKNLNRTLSLETGLTYSYLSTSYKDIDKQVYSASLKLHYIGVPLNLVANIWDITPEWKIYASAGGMIEKGIRSDFTQRVMQTDQKISQSENIKGVQWSINASAGVSYKFYQGWNAYLEPRVSHYFDNNQPLSIRTEKKTILGIHAGFRYDF